MDRISPMGPRNNSTRGCITRVFPVTLRHPLGSPPFQPKKVCQTPGKNAHAPILHTMNRRVGNKYELEEKLGWVFDRVCLALPIRLFCPVSACVRWCARSYQICCSVSRRCMRIFPRHFGDVISQKILGVVSSQTHTFTTGPEDQRN